MSLYPFTERYAQPYFFSCFDMAGTDRVIANVTRPIGETACTSNASAIQIDEIQNCVEASSDEATPRGNDGGETELLYPNKYMNSPKFVRLPPHKLELKVGAPIILLRNLILTGGLCNGTRMIVTQPLSRVIEAQIITGTNQRKTMVESSGPSSKETNKGKITLYEPEVINLMDIKPMHTNKTIEIRVYQKWTASSFFGFLTKDNMSRDVLTVGSTMRIPLLYRGEYSQWVERFMNYLEEQTDGEAMINSIKNGDQPLPRVTHVSIAGTTSTEQPHLKYKSMWSDQEKRI
uniref:DNA helicase n=1 Tax=Tanacetum cinerariifolium TaxID=118510 RepID=A0A699IDX8_TANCI|nr:DNA helicase [Tanacetum cinerariifolium]